MKHPSGRSRIEVIVWLIAVIAAIGFGACSRDDKALAPRSQLFGELRAIRGAITVTPPGEKPHPIMPLQRLSDGANIDIAPNAIAWLRADSGTTMLLKGPARITFGASTLTLSQGKLFIDSSSDDTATTVTTPSGPLHLAHVKASLEVLPEKPTEVYVLSGEVRTPSHPAVAKAGEVLTISGRPDKVTATVSPQVAWRDWTGGLATTQPAPQPLPFGVGSVAARLPGQQGVPRMPLAIRRMDVRVTIIADLAVTEVEQLFFNGSDQTVEGVYSLRTPPDAALNRFGVDRDGVMVWGHVKEQKAAKRQYESHVYEGSTEDPALLEWNAPGVYQARLYPIESGATRRVIVRYSQWLGRTGDDAKRRMYVFPMAAQGAIESMPHIEFFGATIDLEQSGAKQVRTAMGGTIEKNRVLIRAHDLVPQADLAVELLDDGPNSSAYVAVHGIDDALIAPDERPEARRLANNEQDYILIPVKASDVPKPTGGLDLILVIDTSAGTDPSSLLLARQAVSAILTHTEAPDRALVLAGDASLHPVIDGWDSLQPVTDQLRKNTSTALASLRRGGATDLGAMLADAAARLDPSKRGVLVYLGDGRPTVGELALSDLQTRMSKLARPVRVFGFGLGDNADMAVVQGLSNAGFAERLVQPSDAAQAALRLLEEAEKPALLGVKLDLGPTLERVVPSNLDSLVADTTTWVVARVNGDVPKSVRLTSPSGETTLELKTERITDYGDLRFRWAEGRLHELLLKGAGRAELVDLGIRSGLVTPYTSLYVPTKSEMSASEWNEMRRLQEESQAFWLDLERQSDNTDQQAHSWIDYLPIMVGCSRESESRPGRRFSWLRRDKKEQLLTTEREELTKDDIAATPQSPADNEDPQAAAGAVEIEPPSAAPSPLAGVAPKSAAAPAEAADDIPAPDLEKKAAPAAPEPAARTRSIGRRDKLKSASSPAQQLDPAADSPDSIPADRESVTTETVATGAAAPEQTDSTVKEERADDYASKRPTARGDISANYAAKRATAVASGTESGTPWAEREPSVDTKRAAANDTGDMDSRANAPSIIIIGVLPNIIKPCSSATTQPLGQRIVLWTERLREARGDATAVARVYRGAIALCEAPIWAERSRLLSMMLDALPTIRDQVQLWRIMSSQKKEADAIYRGILTRIATAEQRREFYAIMGVSTADPGQVQQLVERTQNPLQLVQELRELTKKWPDDTALSLVLLNALEDAQDRDGARTLAQQLRARADVDAAVLTQVGELWLRLSKFEAESNKNKARSVQDQAEARRAFGEIVEYSPQEPAARRLLGDLLRAHGWYDQAARQYETLGQLLPNDPGVWLLRASSAQGLGKLDEAIRWTEKVAETGAPSDDTGIANTARAMAATYLAWGRLQAAKEGKNEELQLLMQKTERLLARGSRSPKSTRVTLLWSHPLLHPVLWTSSSGAMVPAPDGDITLGISQVILPSDTNQHVEIRLDKTSAQQAARLGLSAVLTVIFDEGKPSEKVIKHPVSFASTTPVYTPTTLRFTINPGEVTQ